MRILPECKEYNKFMLIIFMEVQLKKNALPN